MKKITLLNILCVLSVQLLAQGNIQIEAGAKLVSSNGVSVTLDDMHLNNYGTILQESDGGTFKFTGNMDTHVAGNGKTLFYRMQLDKEKGSRTSLLTNVTIASELQFSNGILNLGENILDLGEHGFLIRESESSYAYATGNGYVQVMNRLHAPSGINPGNLGVIITSSSDLGTTIIRRGNINALKATPQRSSILRYYDIIPANNTNLNARIGFTYFDSELNMNEESLLNVWKSKDRITWTNEGYKIRNTTVNYLEQEKVNEFLRFTLSASNDLSSAYNSTNSRNEILKEKFSIWPNPVKEKTTVSITSVQDVKLKMVLYDSKGSLIRKQETNLQAGANHIEMNMNYLPQGTYLLNASWGGTNKTIRLSKL